MSYKLYLSIIIKIICTAFDNFRRYSDTENDNMFTETYIHDTNDRYGINVTIAVDKMIMRSKHDLLCKELHINYNTKDDQFHKYN